MRVRTNSAINELDVVINSSKKLRDSSRLNRNIITVALLSVLIIGCSSPSGLSDHNAKGIVGENMPAQWQVKAVDSSEENQVSDAWLKSFDDNALEEMITYALTHNFQLNADRYNVDLARERLKVSTASDFPELSLSLDNTRRKQVSNSGETSYQTSADIGIDLRYELDLWGKLSDEQNQDRLDYAAAQANFQENKLNLVAKISKAWFDLIQAQQLLNLYQERAENLQRNLSMIQSSYELGLNDALDVYLTKNTVNQELSRVAQQQQIVQVNSRALELLLGNYPLVKEINTKKLPLINTEINLGLPAQLLTRRADIQAQWLALLALDAGLAVAHKQRFPSLNLNANINDSSNELSNLLNGDALAWSLIGSVTSPLFNAGRLESLEQQAKLLVEQKEQQYLQQVYQAFAEVENSISERDSLNQRYAYYLTAKENALAAEKLSFDQYLRGLVTYTTVLESQRRSFDAQTTVIQLTNELLQNRVDIYRALGGNYLADSKQAAQSTNENSLLQASLTHQKSMDK